LYCIVRRGGNNESKHLSLRDPNPIPPCHAPHPLLATKS
jgi:hypothetical protein